MKAVILAGGLGSRLSEETATRPKPMVEIGGRPVLWHLMKVFSAQGVNDFIICCGYKGFVIKEYFANYYLHQADVTFDVGRHSMEVHAGKAEPWRVTLIDTGDLTMTGGRLKRVGGYLNPHEDFYFTYGDGLADIDLRQLDYCHVQGHRLATVTAVQPPARFGALTLDGDRVSGFREKPEGESWINGGFFRLSPRVLDYIAGDDTPWERGPLERLSREQQLTVYLHRGFFQPMDTLRDRNQLEELWRSGRAPWAAVWRRTAAAGV